MFKIIPAIVGIVTFLFLLSIPSFAATISITNSPSSAALLQEFNVSFSANGLDASSSYYGKVRIGVSGSDSNPYDKGETKNGDSWLGDSSAWGNFPVFATDSGGVVSGSLAARAKSTASLGDNNLFIRLLKVGTATTNKIDSSAATITLTAVTPTPTPSPTPTPTATPAASPTPSPTPTPAATPKPTTAASSTSTPKPVVSSPTPVGTPKITTVSKTTPTPESLVLGITDVNSPSAGLEGGTGTPEASAKKTGLGFSGKQYLAGALAIAGVLFLGISAFLFFNEQRSSKIKNTDEVA